MAGNEFTSVKVTPSELEVVTGAEGWCDVCKGWEDDKEEMAAEQQGGNL